MENIVISSGMIMIESPLTLNDAEELTMLANDQSIPKTIGSKFPFPYIIDKNRIDNGKPFIIDFFIKYDNIRVGVIGLSNIDYRNNSAHFGYWVNSKFRGKGIASTALHLVCEFSRDQLKLHRLHTKVMSNNPASMKVLLKNEFRIEGIEKDALKIGEDYIDMFKFGLIL
ncbi:MAG: GNAT family N-acetyltransferase [Thermoplasmataceae archaeon]